MDKNLKLYDKIKEIAEYKHIPISTIVRKLNISYATMHKWNYNYPSLKYVIPVCNLLGITLNDLMSTPTEQLTANRENIDMSIYKMIKKLDSDKKVKAIIYLNELINE